ncbi:MAG: hypothetical protein RSD49_08340 [Hafnia sp.]
MTDNNELKNYVATESYDEAFLNPSTGSLVVVDSMSGDYQVSVLFLHDGGVIAQYQGYGDESDDHEDVYIKAECPTHDDFKQFILDSRIILPVGFWAGLDSGVLPESGAYEPVLADIVCLKGTPFEAHWTLSYESADDIGHYRVVSTLSEAMEVLAKAGAMKAVPGNFGSISVGSLELFHTNFRSDGIDNGDSHINPGVDHVKTNLFTEIIDYEQKQKMAIEAKAEKRNQQRSSNNGFSL